MTSRVFTDVGALRRAVFERALWQCEWPGCMSRDDLQLAHLTHRGMGGNPKANTPDNCACLCKSCHNVLDGRDPMGARWLAMLIDAYVRASRFRQESQDGTSPQTDMSSTGGRSLPEPTLKRWNTESDPIDESSTPPMSTIETVTGPITMQRTSSPSLPPNTKKNTMEDTGTTGPNSIDKATPLQQSPADIKSEHQPSTGPYSGLEKHPVPSPSPSGSTSTMTNSDICIWPGCDQEPSPVASASVRVRRSPSGSVKSEYPLTRPVVPCLYHADILDGRTVKSRRYEVAELLRAFLRGP